MNLAHSIAALFRRDLARLRQQVEAFPDDATLWETAPGMTNPAGNLVLHLEGNLREYIGRQLGGLPYARERPREFASTGVPRDELIARVASLGVAIPAVIERLSKDTLDADYPEVVLEKPMSTQQFLVHLYGHLNWHLGQIDSIRRGLTAGGALKLAGL